MDYSQQQLTCAGFWIRLLASVLDYVPMVIFSALFSYNDSLRIMATYNKMVIFIPFILLIIYWIYLMFAEAGSHQATPGQRICGLCVVGRHDKLAIGYFRALVRYWVSRIFWFLNLFLIPFTREKTGIHDWITESRVVYGRR